MRTIFLLSFLAVCSIAALAEQQSNAPITISAGPEWIPLRPELEIEAGSALDFSAMGFTDGPAGKHGRVIARQDGQFAFEDSPKIARRFYGVNLCFSAQYLTHEQSDRLAERLARIGYNAVRIHHYERELTQGQSKSTTLNAQKLDQLDYLFAALIRRGIYLTTDLFVSRGVPYREVGIERDGEIPMNNFKVLVPVHDGAFNNWKEFSTALLTHTNAYTHRRYADEPALAWLAMINEGNFGNYIKEILTIPEWKQAWNRWLVKRYGGREALAAAWSMKSDPSPRPSPLPKGRGGSSGSASAGDVKADPSPRPSPLPKGRGGGPAKASVEGGSGPTELKEDEDPAAGSVALPERLQVDGLRARDCIAFLADTEREMVQRMKGFLRDELGCRALISNASSWTRFTTDQGARTVYDYVDDHFYVDHPKFLETPWRLPSRCSNASPLAEGAPGGRPLAFTRLFDKPFTVTEYNYSAPGQFRGVGGILTGALGALQGWGGIWRFAYSHSREAIFTPVRMDYFNMAGDPLSQAAERASLCLFLRGDLQMAPHAVALVMTEADLAHPAARIPTLAPKWNWAAWVTRVGTEVVEESRLRPTSARQAKAGLPADAAILPLGWQTPASAYKETNVLSFDPYSVSDDKLLEALKDCKLLKSANGIDPGQKMFRSETDEITIDGPHGWLVLDTARTAGGYAPAGQVVEAVKGGVRISFADADATLWVSALDDKPIGRSHRLLVTHLTDLQNTDIRYAEPAKQTLLDWGRLPYLVKAGKAEVSIRLDAPKRYRVWALSPGGKRMAVVATQVEGQVLRFTADVAGEPGAGARMLYEVALVD